MLTLKNENHLTINFQDLLLNSIPLPSLLLNFSDFTIIYSNDLFLKLINFKEKNKFDNSISELLDESLFLDLKHFYQDKEKSLFSKTGKLNKTNNEFLQIELHAKSIDYEGIRLILITIIDKSNFFKELSIARQQNQLMGNVLNNFPFITFTTNSFYDITSCQGMGMVRLNKFSDNLTGLSINNLFGNIETHIEKVQKYGSINFELYGSDKGESWCFDIFIIGIAETGLMGFAIDVTEQKIAEAAQEKIKRQLQQVTFNIPGAVFQLFMSKEKEYKLVYVSQGLEQLSGITPENAMKDLSVIFQRLGSRNLRILRYMFRKSEKNMESINCEAQMGAEGNKQNKWIRINAMPTLNNDGSVVWYGTASDITHSKNIETELIEKKRFIERVTASTPDVIYVYDVQLQKNIFCNREIGELLGYTEQEIHVLQSTLKNELIHPEDIEKLNQYFENVKNLKDEEILELEYRFKNKSGIYTWFLTRNTIFLRNKKGIVIQFMGTIVNINRRKLAEQQTLERNLELLKINSELDQFVYSTSHDLRSPLTSIEGLLSLIKEEQDPIKKDEFIELIQRSVGKLDVFIKRIIDYSRNSRLPTNIQKINFDYLFNDIIELLKFGANASAIRFEVAVKGDFDFYSDYDRLHIIISNLISNAIRYHNPRVMDNYILIKAGLSENEVVISVADNGLGMEASNLDKIFDMFYRISSKSEGSGLGLYIVKESVNKIDGTIKVESVINEGTQFTIRVPNSKPE